MIKYARKTLPDKIKDKLPDLFKYSGNFTYDLEHYFEYWEGKKLVGAVQLEYRDPMLVKFKPAFSLFIYNFEIVPEERGRGYGKRIIESLIKDLPIYEIELTYWNNASRKFWWSLGFRVVEKETRTMKKKIKKR